MQPGDYAPNWWYLGQCYMNMGQKEKARQWLEKAAEYQGDDPDGKEVN